MEDARALRIRHGLAELVSTPSGRRWLWSHLVDDCGVFAGSYVQGDALHTTFVSGRRSIGVELLERLARDHPDAYRTLLAEGPVFDVEAAAAAAGSRLGGGSDR